MQGRLQALGDTWFEQRLLTRFKLHERFSAYVLFIYFRVSRRGARSSRAGVDDRLKASGVGPRQLVVSDNIRDMWHHAQQLWHQAS